MNVLLSVKEVYIDAAFEILREEVLTIHKDYFKKLGNYYNLLFALFVSILIIAEMLVSCILVNKLSTAIIKMYHVVLLIPFSGRT